MKSTIFTLFICALFLIPLGYADIPKTLSFQARLTDNDGVPLTGSHNVIFSIYEKDGTAPLWQEEHKDTNAVTLEDGICNVILGLITPLGIDFNKPYFISITIDGAPLMEKYPLSSSAYAINADKLGGLPAGQYLRSNATGNMGVGTTSPLEKLSVEGNIRLNAVVQGYSDITFTRADSWNPAKIRQSFPGGMGGDISFWTNSIANHFSEKMRVTSEGNVGIGTPAPQSSLQIGSTVVNMPTTKIHIGSLPANAFQNVLTFDFQGNGGVRGVIGGMSDGASYQMLSLGTNGFGGDQSQTLNLRSGNAGIGTTRPQATLDVQGAAGAPVTERLSGYAGGNRSVVGSLDFYNTEAHASAVQGQIKTLRGLNDYKAGQLGFFTSATTTGTLTERMTIDEYGNVGIGTASPRSSLHIGSTVVNMPATKIHIGSLPANAFQNVLTFDFQGNGGVRGVIGGVSDAASYQMLSLGTNGFGGDHSQTLNLRNGNVGIGTAAPLEKLSVEGNIRLNAVTQNYSDLTFTRADSWNPAKIRQSFPGGMGGDLSFWTNSMVNYFSEKMRVTSEGNVGIGTAAPSAKLDVKGSVVIDGEYMKIPVISGNPSSVKKGMIWFDAAEGTFKCATGDGQVKRFKVE